MKKIYSILCLFIVSVAITSCSKDDDPTPALSSLNSITSFEISFNGVNAKDVITKKSGENITISVPFQTSLTDLKPIIKTSEKSTVSPASGKTVTFVDGEPKTYTVTAEDGTVKTYTVTISTRGEVGNGSKLKTYRIKDNTGQDILTSYEYDENSNFVNKYTEKNGAKTTVYTLVYDTKNQVIEKKSDKESTIYKYNEEGQIISAEQKNEGKLAYSFTYTYAKDGSLSSYTRVNENDKKKDVNSYKYSNENVSEKTTGSQTLKATYDDKNNPFYSIYPKAYRITNLGTKTDNANKNNPIKGDFTSNTDITYIYNKDNYPETAKYTIFGFLNIEVTYSYY